MSGSVQRRKATDEVSCSLMDSLWLHALAKAGGDPRRFEWATWPMTYVSPVKA